jgi:hypothetical protein
LVRVAACQRCRDYGCDHRPPPCAIHRFRIVTGLDLDAFIAKRNTIPDAVAFRIDTAEWLATLSDRQRRRAKDLAEGYSTSECARRWGVSAAAVSLYRRQLNESYQRFLNT